MSLIVILVDGETITKHDSVGAAMTWQQAHQDRMYDEHVPIVWHWDPVNEQHRGLTESPPSVVYVKEFSP